MPRYYFHSTNGCRERDADGTEFPDDRAAQAAAIRFAGEVLVDADGALSATGQWRVEVTDAKGALLFIVVTLAIEAPEIDEVAVFAALRDGDDEQVGAFLQGSPDSR